VAAVGRRTGGRIVPFSREMILDLVAQHVLDQEKSY
jgi:hypothetical protein